MQKQNGNDRLSKAEVDVPFSVDALQVQTNWKPSLLAPLAIFSHCHIIRGERLAISIFWQQLKELIKMVICLDFE